MPPRVVRLADLPAALDAERIDVLATGGAFRFEHILSGAQASPPGSWYDQDDDEWACLVAGRATLAFEDGAVDLVAGDAILIPAHVRHRVARSDDAVWLALHFTQPT